MSRNERIILTNKYKNILQSVVLISLMGLLLWGLNVLIFGSSFLFYFLIIPVLFILLNPGLSHRVALRIRGARELTYRNAPEIYERFYRLSQKAGLDPLPRFFLIPTYVPNAFSFGTKRQAAVVITRGLLEYLSVNELEGVLAHELGHIKNNDLLILQLARGVVWFTSSLSFAGLMMLIFSLPLLFGGHLNLSFIAVILLLLAPTLSRLLWLALSRTREFQADLSAAQLTGDPESLASALYKIQSRPFSLFGRIFFPAEEPEDNPAAATHPATRERIKRLRAYRAPEPVFRSFGHTITW